MLVDLRALADSGDLDALGAALRQHPPQPRGLARLIDHPDRRVGQLALTWLLERVGRCPDPDRLRAWAALLPTDPGAWPPEAQAGLADLHVRLERWGARLPDWRAADLPPAQALPWLAAALSLCPTDTVALEGTSEGLLHALGRIRGGGLRRPAALVEALLDHQDDRLLDPAARLLEEAARAGRLAPAVVARLLTRLVIRGSEPALAALDMPWGRATPLPKAALLTALGSPRRGPTAVAVLHGRGDRATLEAIALGDLPGPRAEALGLLGAHVDRVELLLEVAASDPLAFGPALRRALEAAHRRGVFVRPGDVGRLLALFLAHTAWPAGELAALCHPARDALVEQIARVAPDDDAWLRLTEVLAESEGRAAPTVVRRLLERGPPPAIERAALAAVASQADVEAESLVIAALPRHPVEALAALRMMGGTAAARALSVALGIEPPGAVAPYLLAHIEAAVTLLWQLTPPRTKAREALLERLNPGALPRAVSADVEAERSSAARRQALNAALFLRPDQALVRLAAVGEETTYDTLYGLLRQTVVGLHDGTVPGDAPLGTDHTRGRPQVPGAVVEALIDYGRALAARGRIRPHCVAQAEKPGHALLAELAVDLALWGGLEAPMQRCLLTVVAGLEAPRVVRRVHPLLRHKDPGVRAEAIRILTSQRGQALSFSIARLLRQTDPITLRPAIEAVAGFGLRWATPQVAALLDHPDMNIKKVAAEALEHLDAGAALERVVFWLGRHDNPGLRASLGAAYDAAKVGPEPLLAALMGADARTEALLLRALEGRLGPGHLRRLLEAEHPVAAQVLPAVAAGRLGVRGGLEGLRAELVRYGHPAAERLPVASNPTPRGIRRLHVEGWDEEAAREALATPDLLGPLLDRYAREWLALLPRLEDAAQGRLLAALPGLRSPDAVRAAVPALLDALAEQSHAVAALEGGLTALGRVQGLSPAMAGRAIDAVRALPPTAAGDGRLRLGVLRRLGAVPIRADLEAALADCDQTPDPRRHARAILRSAFSAVELVEAPDVLLAPIQADDPAAAAAAVAQWPRARLGELLGAIARSGPRARGVLIDRLLELQPLGCGPWSRVEAPERRRAAAPAPTGAARRETLLTALATGSPRERAAAAEALLDWGDVAEAHLAVLDAWLAEEVEVAVDHQWALADALARAPERLRGPRALELVEWLPLNRRRQLEPHLWALWEAGVPGAAEGLRRLGAAFLLPRVARSVAQGGVTSAALLTHGPMPQGPTLDAVAAALRRDGQHGLAEDIQRRARPGPLGVPEPPEAPPPSAPSPGDDREALFAAARGADPGAARGALRTLSRAADDEVIALMRELTEHQDPARRIVALRALRRCAPRDVYLEAAMPFLHDPRPDVQRSVIRSLSHARYPPAMGAVVELLRHGHRAVREAAFNGLRVYGTTALSTLTRARRRARPDHRHLYERVIEAIEADPRQPRTVPPRGRTFPPRPSRPPR